MTLVVPYPWYMTWWFICSCILLLGSAYFLTIFSFNRRKEQKLKAAMQEQEQKVYEEKGNPPCTLCVISGLERYAYTRPDGVVVVPFTSLCP